MSHINVEDMNEMYRVISQQIEGRPVGAITEVFASIIVKIHVGIMELPDGAKYFPMALRELADNLENKELIAQYIGEQNGKTDNQATNDETSTESNPDCEVTSEETGSNSGPSAE